MMKEEDLPPNSFQQWSSDSLRNLLIDYNVQVRGAKDASHETLVRICQDVFEDEENYMNEEHFSRTYTIEELLQMNDSAKTIQRAYFEYRRFMRRKSWKNTVLDAREHFLNYNDEDNVDQESDYIEYYDESDHEYDFDDRSQHISEDFSDDHSSFDEYHNDVESSMGERSYNSSNDEKHSETDNHRNVTTRGTKPPRRSRQLEKELEAQWVKPSWKKAKLFEAENRPHQSGVDMKPYHWRKTTLGRHCTVGGCGEQLDLWNEGQVSEFSQFGSGITNYFKFQKWCCWIMFILSVLHVPVIFFNLQANNNDYDSNLLAMTTLGNLGDSELELIKIPKCDEDAYHFDNCYISKNFLAILYSSLDAMGTVIVIFGFYWLRLFQKTEVDHLNRATVDASDYTLRAKGIPPDITEREIAVHFAKLTGEPVADVNIAFNNANEIRMYSSRGAIMKQRFKCIQQIRYEKSIGQHIKGKKQSAKRRLASLLRQRKRLTVSVDYRDALRDSRVKQNPDAIQAFVTFDTERGFLKAISSYQMSWIRSLLCFYPDELKMKGYKLSVSQAPEPSTIIWENLEINERKRFLRKSLTTFVASLAILLSIFFTFRAREFKLDAMERMKTLCPQSFLDLNEENQYDAVVENDSLADCYCANLDTQDRLGESICVSFVRNQIKATSMTYGAACMVAFMNMFFTILMDRAGSYEKHHSLDEMESSNMTRVFLLKFANTGLLFLLYSSTIIQTIVGVKFEDPHNFNVEWFETGGVGIIIVMIINIFSPHLGSLFSYFRYRSRIAKVERNLTEDYETDDNYKIWYTQEELNNVYLGPPFRLNYRYTQLLVNFYICWMYAISMPILPIIGFLSFFCSYWIDKYLFCNFYRIPPKYSDKIGSRSTSLIGYAIVLHILMSCWMLGNSQIFPGEYFSDRGAESIEVGDLTITDVVFKKHIMILIAIGIFFVMNSFLQRFLSTFVRALTKVTRCLFCSVGNKVQKLTKVMNTVQVSYSGARERGVIKGLASYNIMQNPKYQEAFAITREFAERNNRLSAIRGYNTKEKRWSDSESSKILSSSEEFDP